ncbi:MAG: DUF3617 family protein [Pseudomonadota bacterium]
MNAQLLAAAAVIALGLGGAASAQTMKVKPGLWESTIVMTGPMASTRTDTECFTDGEWSPDDLMDEETSICEPTNVQVTDNSMSFDLACTANGMNIAGDMSYKSQGESGSGKMNVAITGGGMNMAMSADMTAKWLGPC